MITKTLKFRIKDKHAKHMLKQSKEINMVWNYINDLSCTHTQRTGKYFSEFDLHQYTTGATKYGLSIPAASIQSVNKEYITRRRQHKKLKLKWRKSGGNNRSLGWIPLKASSLKYKSGQIFYQNKPISIWDSHGLSNHIMCNGSSFNEDARGRWYLNIVVKVSKIKSKGTKSVGIDLGCKESATTSDGEVLIGRQYRKLEQSLAKAQRAKKKGRTRAIHAKIKNRRKDEQHKFTTKLVNGNALIVVGDVSSKKLIKTKLAKSVLDAGWYQMKTMLEYKCHQAGVVFLEVNESYSTQICSHCGCIPASSPKGRAGLGIRVWTCAECGESHDRDVNAAKNILVAGHCHLAGGII